MAETNFDLKGFLNDPKAQANKPAAIKYLQQKGIIDTQGNAIKGTFKTDTSVVNKIGAPFDFVAKDIIGIPQQTPGQEGGIGGGVKNFAASVFQSTLGSKGAAGFGANIAKTAMLPKTMGDIQSVENAGQATTDMAHSADSFIKQAMQTQDPAQKQKLLKLAGDIIKTASTQGDQNKQNLQQVTANTPTVGGVLGTAGNTALTALTGGGSALAPKVISEALPQFARTVPGVAGLFSKSTAVNYLARAIENGVATLGFTAADNAIEGKNVGDNLGTAAIIASVIPAGGELSRFSSPIRNWLTENLPSRLINVDIKPLERMFKFGRNPGDAIVEEGITANTKGGLVKAVVQKKNDVWTQLKSIYANPQVASKVDNFSGAVDIVNKQIEQAAKGGKENQGLVTRLGNFRDYLLKTYKSNAKGEVVSSGNRILNKLKTGDAFQLKKDIGEGTVWTGKASEDSALNAVKKEVYNFFDEKIDKMAPGTEDLNRRYGNLLNAQKASERAAIQAEKTHLVKLGNRFGIGLTIGYGILSGNWKTAGELLVAEIGGEIAGSTAVRTRVAKFLDALAPGQRDSIFNATPTLRNMYEKVTGKTPKGESPIKEKAMTSQEEGMAKINKIKEENQAKYGQSPQNMNPKTKPKANRLPTKKKSDFDSDTAFKRATDNMIKKGKPRAKSLPIKKKVRPNFPSGDGYAGYPDANSQGNGYYAP